jgi:capsular exopolysaccharide synthesis family protein
LDDRIHSDDDVRHASGLPVLTHVPVIKDVAHQTLIGLPGVREGSSTALATTASYHAAPLLESFRMLRANLMFSATVEPIRSIVVTSSRPSEGKSSCAVNLAVALALDGKSVILVDCDLRRPKTHDLLSLRNSIGFTSVVTGQVSIEDALQTCGIANLKVLTGGPVPPNPTELLNSRAGRACLKQLMGSAEFVILDTPPALVMADAQMVASQADTVLLVVSANEADKREVARTTELMAQTGARLLGTVLIKSDTSTGGYYNYSTYSQYYATPLEGTETTQKGKA